MARPKRATVFRHIAVMRFPPDLKKYLEAVAWNEGTSLPTVVDKHLRKNIEKLFRNLPDSIRERYLKEISETPSAA